MPFKDPDKLREYKRKYDRKWRKNPARMEYSRKWWRTPAGRACSKRQMDRRRKRGKELILQAKDRPCADCKKRFPSCCMDFDHVRGKKRFQISYSASRSPRILKLEIAKCDVVCANCHRIRHNGGEDGFQK